MRIHWKRFFRLRRWVKSISFFLSDPIYRLPQNEVREKGSLLLIKTEAIGDYILFRNFLQSIRENEKFRGYQIFLIGNELWKPLVNKFDQPYLDFSFFINKKKFLSEPKYRQEFLSQFSKIHFDKAINCTYSREFISGDLMMRSISAKEKIGMIGNSVSEIPPLKWVGNFFYSRLVGSDRNNYFEFDCNKYFFEQVLEEKVDIEYPILPIKLEEKGYVVLLPGAQDKAREWPANSFKDLAKRLHNQYKCKIILTGSKAEIDAANCIIDSENSTYVENLCGQTKLEDLPELLAGARLAVCNDSGTLHIAAALGVPSICISNGNHFGRFTPYPNFEKRKLAFLYPKRFLNEHKTENERRSEMAFGSKYSIGEIGIEEVWEAVVKLMHE